MGLEEDIVDVSLALALARADDPPPNLSRLRSRQTLRSPSDQWIVVLRCGAGRHRSPPRVGEVSLSLDGGGPPLVDQGVQGMAHRLYGGRDSYLIQEQKPTALRFPCRRDCPADWNVITPRLITAYRRAVESGRRTLVFGVDL
jgi:hypothetical protein